MRNLFLKVQCLCLLKKHWNLNAIIKNWSSYGKPTCTNTWTLSCHPLSKRSRKEVVHNKLIILSNQFQWAMFDWLTRAGSDYRVEQEMLGLWLCLKNCSFFFFLILRRRRGAINAKQLTYLEQYKPSKLLKEKGPANNCCVQWCYENTEQLSVYFKLNFWQRSQLN